MADAITTPAHPLLPPPFSTSTQPFELVAQGAESLLFKTTSPFPPPPASPTPTPHAALKLRPTKPWRHPSLDRRLTRGRILAEARILVKLGGEGVASLPNAGKKAKARAQAQPRELDGGMRGAVPAVLGLDWEQGWMMMEWVEGRMVKDAIRQGVRDGAGEEAVRGLLRRIGEVVGRLHGCGVIHGDLTTSNIMLRPRRREGPAGSVEGPLDGDLVLIDFGLATQAVSEEDRAVDLYVLERAYGSTHPKEEHLFPELLRGYAESEGSGMCGKSGKVVLRRLEDVRMRGRKKSMVG